ncbi:MAG: ABC transporter substrate-binding protein [Synergistaceae bacterium]|nr:ABC transporter substrate-binding protein [Synergistaceae bacterium]
MKGYKPFALTLILLLFLSFPAAGAERIVSLAPAVTEALFALGEGASVVGVTDFDVSPEEVLALPRVGGYLDPSLERILSLRPTLVVGTETFHGPLLERLATLVPRTLSLSLHRRLDDVEKALLALGGYLGKEAEARAPSGTGSTATWRLCGSALPSVSARGRPLCSSSSGPILSPLPEASTTSTT